jgi:selenocysteine-specific elongation factor
MKPARSIVIGTAGHIDHGKTALVRALTGIDTDRLPEEKRRGITIDLGFASFEIAAPDSTPTRISFVDVPGHALFIRNMLAGAGCVPAVMLVIAADEGVMPQTREHLAICQLLGMCDGFTVITKCDMVSEAQLFEMRNQIAAFLKGSFLYGHSIVTASAHNGTGLESVQAELATLALRVHAGKPNCPVRLPIDRTFVKKGFGAVVTGTLLGGRIRVGDNLALAPGSRIVRVRGLQTHGESEEAARPGSRVAVNLSGVDSSEISRGQTLVVPDELRATDTIDAEVDLLAGAPPLKHRARVHFHAFTSEVMATVVLYRNEAVEPGGTRLARLRLSAPIVLVPGDRFVIRQPLPAGTIGGGLVLDAHPLPQARRSETREWLEKAATATSEQQLMLRVQRRGSQGMRFDDLGREMGLTIAAVRELVVAPVNRGEVRIMAADLLIAEDAIRHVSEDILPHLKSAGAGGIKRSELQSRTELPPEVLSVVVDRLVADRKAQVRNEVVAIAGAGPQISGKESRELRTLSAAYLSAGLAAPSVREAAAQLRIPEPELRRLITLLLREKTLVRMGSDDAFVHAEPLRQLAARLGTMRGRSIDVTGFKELTGLTRRHAIPLLEYLDRERITRKQGDVRLIL